MERDYIWTNSHFWSQKFLAKALNSPWGHVVTMFNKILWCEKSLTLKMNQTKKCDLDLTNSGRWSRRVHEGKCLLFPSNHNHNKNSSKSTKHFSYSKHFSYMVTQFSLQFYILVTILIPTLWIKKYKPR
jgi:hypothetical protein